MPSADRLTAVTFGLLLAFVSAGCGTTPHEPGSRPTLRPSVREACTASSLTVTGTWQGATGSMLGDIAFTNTGTRWCALPGYLGLELVNQRSQVLAVQVQRGQAGSAALPTGAVAKAVVLAPGKPNSASETLQWSNWCGATPDNLALDVVLPDHEKVAATPVRQPWGVPRCDDSAAPSVIVEGPVLLS
jgi:hypothetical protein